MPKQKKTRLQRLADIQSVMTGMAYLRLSLIQEDSENFSAPEIKKQYEIMVIDNQRQYDHHVEQLRFSAKQSYLSDIAGKREPKTIFEAARYNPEHDSVTLSSAWLDKMRKKING